MSVLETNQQKKNQNQRSVNDIIKFITKYESVFRFSRNRLLFPENLVSHIGIVTILGTYMMDDINYSWALLIDDPEDVKDDQLIFSAKDYAAYMRRAVVHDMDEIVTGDIVRPTKYANEVILSNLKELEERSVDTLVEEYHLPTKWKSEWKQAKKDRVGLILKTADLMSVMITCYRECILFSNRQFMEVADEAIDFSTEYFFTLKQEKDKSENDVTTYVLDAVMSWVLSSIKLLDRRYIDNVL